MSVSMASAPASDQNIDLEAQHHVSRYAEVGGSGDHETSITQRQSGTLSDSSQALLLSNNQAVTPDANSDLHSFIQHNKVGQRRSVTPITDVDQPKHNDSHGHVPTSTQVGSDEKQVEGNRAAVGDPPVNGDPPSGSSDPEPRMIGDFDGNAHAFWKFFNSKAKIHDGTRMKTLKEDLDSPLVFAGLFSAVLTAFLIDNKQNLKVSPQDQMVYYLQQNVAILDQISHQISTIVPQFPIPSNPPPPYPAFKPLASDICVNVFWFMSLIFSLTAALLAILVQKWARDYMHVFDGYSEPLKSARRRQYLIEGLEECHLPFLAEAVPGLLHISLFLFFVGLCDSLLNINTAVGLSTTIPIGITGLLYIFTAFAPVIYPQSPFQNVFSVFIWRMSATLGRRFKIRDFNIQSKSLSSDITEGQTQLAMEETGDRKERDERAIQWLVSNTTEDVEMESLMMTIPGSFNGQWGKEVWKKTSSATPLVGSMLETCKNRDFFASDELWRRRTRACIETTASLVCCVGAELGQFGDMLKLLGDIGSDQAVRSPSSIGKERSFVMHWTCLSLVAIRSVLDSNVSLHDDARLASQRLGRMDNPRDGQTRAGKIIETLDKASGSLRKLSDELIWGGTLTEERVQQIFRANESHISELEQINIKNTEFQMDDWSINSVQNFIDRIANEVITRQLPGVKSDFNDTESVNFSEFVELFRDPQALIFILPLRNLKRIHSFALTLRRHLEGHCDVNTFQEMIKNLRQLGTLFKQWDKPLDRQVWRLQDLSDGGGLGFTVELFFLALKQLLSESSSKKSQSALYIGTFHAITSDWRKLRNSLGTQRLLLDMVAPDCGIIFGYDYPDYIVDEFLAFLRNTLQVDGEIGYHIDGVVQQLTGFPTHRSRHALSVKVLNGIPRGQAFAS